MEQDLDNNVEPLYNLYDCISTAPPFFFNLNGDSQLLVAIQMKMSHQMTNLFLHDNNTKAIKSL